MQTSEKVPKVPRALLVLFPGFEEIEAVTPLDLLRRAGVEVVTVAVGSEMQERLVTGGRAVVLQADALLTDFGEAPEAVFDLLILPGGPGVGALRARPELGRDREAITQVVRRFDAAKKWVAAICAAPLLLHDAGITGNLKVTSFPGEADALRPHVRAYVEERVVLDGHVVTSRGAGTSEEFALALVALLAGAAVAEDLRRRIVARA
jgi:4-methyl-5(b-hydroxyethyl)-thiazole monophosphate biosynthesis